MRVHTITFGTPRGPSHQLTALSSEMLHQLIANKHELVVDPDAEGDATLDDFIDQCRIILSLREQGAPI